MRRRRPVPDSAQKGGGAVGVLPQPGQVRADDLNAGILLELRGHRAHAGEQHHIVSAGGQARRAVENNAVGTTAHEGGVVH